MFQMKLAQYVILSLFISICIPSISFSQVNIEGLRSLDTMKLHAAVGISGMLQTGNVEQQQLGLNGNISFKIKRSEFIIIARGQYSWANENQFSNDALLHFRNAEKIFSFLFLESYLQYNFDRILLIDNRYVAGSGLRLKIFNKTNLNIFIGTSAMYEYEELALPISDAHPDETSYLRWSNYLSAGFIVNENVAFSTANYFQPRFSKLNDYRVLSDNSLLVKLTEYLQFSVTYHLRYDSIQPDELVDTDTRINIGVNLLI